MRDRRRTPRKEHHFSQAPVAQLDRVPGYEPGGRRFESFRARHENNGLDPLGLGRFRLSHHRVTKDVGKTLQDAMRTIEAANPGRFDGIFGDAPGPTRSACPTPR